MVQAAPTLRLSKRPVYHMFRDQALSFNPLGNLIRNFAFACLSPHIFCNSQFTAAGVNGRLGKVEAILYPPVDPSQFSDSPPAVSPPKPLLPILQTGARIMLTPSRISQPNQVNDKNLRALLPLLAHLKATGHNYHGVVIGQDTSPGQLQTRLLLHQADCWRVADRFTVLPPTFEIQEYYKYADIVVTLAPREPFGRTVVEAIACGVPVIGSKTGGIGEILHHFAPEWAVDPNDPVAAASAVIHTVNNPNNPNVLTKGKYWLEEHCSAMDYARRLLEMIGTFK
jgi:glycosyltransferase involved in cell wall biosynthesis